MSKDQPHPVPRDADDASFSEMVPLKSSKINIVKSPLFLLVMATAAITVLTFQLLSGVGGGQSAQARMDAFATYSYLVAGYMLLLVVVAIFLYSKTDKPLWANFSNFAFVWLVMVTPLAIPYFYIFRTILPGKLVPNMTAIQNFIAMFFAAGLMEELMKVTLVLIGAYVTYNAATWKPKLPDALYKAIRVRGPLDGLMLGIFGGAAFIMIETLNQYVPGLVKSVQQQSGNEFGGYGFGLMLLFPRVAGGIVGHMAWAGITGYFIGLAVVRPSMWWKLIGGAWLVTSALHATWNTQDYFQPFAWISAIAGGALFLACLLKARQLEQTLGRDVDTYGSIVVEKAPAAPQAQPAPAAAAAPASKEKPIALAIGDLQIALGAGATLDLSNEPALGGKGAGVLGEGTQHPTRPDVLGLKNTGTAEWTATLRDGSTTTIESGRNLRLAPGVKVSFGAVEADVIAL
ncbi:MAG: PrsW family intramembrane metalloprotease [Sphingomonadales bacterium]